ncbi:PEP-CTERM sorting domain-containing protein [Pseudocolwellia agarivorans]|uniref:PEP-CTERM sorting domain-containing protein n=1 Tax=Pseudocolwellia agarivorans TaxID=1911682 RepID=UPI0009846A9C|nr:PEP-CTERM sorting domain-containing protein [Pseudocolwellia agarivorans]
MKKIICLIAGLFLGTANAGIIAIDHNILLPISGTENIDLDMDGTFDIGMAERFTGGDKSWVTLDSVPQSTQMVAGFVPEGALIDNSLTWLTSGFQDPVMSIGNNYLGIFDTSLGAFFGYATITYNGTDMTLATYTYDDSGEGLVVGSTSVPETGTLALFGLALAGVALTKRKKIN